MENLSRILDGHHVQNEWRQYTMVNHAIAAITRILYYHQRITIFT